MKKLNPSKAAETEAATKTPAMTLAELGRRLFAAGATEEAFLSVADAAYRLIGFDYFYVQYSDDGEGILRNVLAVRANSGALASIPATKENTKIPASTAIEGGAHAELAEKKTDKVLRDLPGDTSNRPLAWLVAPIGRSVRNAGRLVLLRNNADAYSQNDIELAQALGNLCSDALARIRAEAEPHAPDDVVQERDLLRMLVDSIPDYLYIKDLESRFILGNLALARSFGAASETEVVGKRDADFAPPELEAQYRADEMAVMSTGQPLVDHGELVVEASGQRVWVSTTKIPLRDVRGRVIGLVGVGHNPHPVTQRDLSQRGSADDTAREAGVSVATVSRAFNGSPRVTEKTRQRIFDAARKVGYQPNAAARSLSKGHTETVALLLNSAHVSRELYAEMLTGIYAVVQRCGYEVLVSLVDSVADATARLDEIVSGKKCAVVAVQADLLTTDQIAALSTSAIPALLLNYVAPDSGALPNIASVGFDYRMGMRQTVRHLVALGHRSIALLDSPDGPNAQLRYEGFAAGMAESGLAVLPSMVRQIPERPEAFAQTDNIEAGAISTQQLLAEVMPRPTAIVCGSDAIAAGAMRAATAWGQSVPGGISITGFGDASWARLLTPSLTTVALRGRDMGIAAGQVMVAHAKDSARSCETVLLPPRLVVRASTGIASVISV